MTQTMNPRQARQAQIDEWEAAHGFDYRQTPATWAAAAAAAMAADEIDAYAADGFMSANPLPVKRQFCRKCTTTGRERPSCVPAVTLTFPETGGRLHWCAEHAADADRYRDQASA